MVRLPIILELVSIGGWFRLMLCHHHRILVQSIGRSDLLQVSQFFIVTTLTSLTLWRRWNRCLGWLQDLFTEPRQSKLSLTSCIYWSGLLQRLRLKNVGLLLLIPITLDITVMVFLEEAALVLISCKLFKILNIMMRFSSRGFAIESALELSWETFSDICQAFFAFQWIWIIVKYLISQIFWSPL